MNHHHHYSRAEHLLKRGCNNREAHIANDTPATPPLAYGFRTVLGLMNFDGLAVRDTLDEIPDNQVRAVTFHLALWLAAYLLDRDGLEGARDLAAGVIDESLAS